MNYYSFKYYGHKIDIILPSIGETAIRVSISGASHFKSVHLPGTSYELVASNNPHLWIIEGFNSAVHLLAEKGFGYIPLAPEPKPWLEKEEDPESSKIPYHWSHTERF